MVPEHLRPTFPDGHAVMPPLATLDGAETVQVAEAIHGISLTLAAAADPATRVITVLAENLARRLAEQILFLVDGTVIVSRDVGHG